MGELFTPWHLGLFVILGIMLLEVTKGVAGGLTAARRLVSRVPKASAYSIASETARAMTPDNRGATIPSTGVTAQSSFSHGGDLPQMKFCSECGKQILRRAEVCPLCGCRVLFAS